MIKLNIEGMIVECHSPEDAAKIMQLTRSNEMVHQQDSNPAPVQRTN